MTPTTHTPYRPDIDGLRAVAVLAVVIFHYWPAALPGGFVGVDIFFVISGFLITGIIWRDLEANRFSFADFWRRRALRIFPSLTTILAACLIFGVLALTPLELTALARHAVAGVTFYSNFLLKSEQSYFDIAAEKKMLLPLWSLGIEEQFYLVWPLTLVLAYRWRARIKALTALLLTASFVYCVLHLRKHPTSTFYLPTSRFWELWAGALLALYAPRPRGRSGTACAVAGGLMLASAILVNNGQAPYPDWHAVLPVLGAVLLLAAGPDALVNRLVLARRPLVAIGLISYPLYLWHWPILVGYRIFWVQEPSIATKFTLLAVAVGATLATYASIERPLRFTARRERTARWLTAGMALIGLFAAALVRADGWASRVRGPLAAYAREHDFAWDEGASTNRCYLQDRALERHAAECFETKRPLVMLWGDSHAAALGAGLRELQARRGFGLLQMAQAGCPPLRDLPRLKFRTNCNEVNAHVLEAFTKARPDVVLLHSAWVDERFPLSEDALVTKMEAMVTDLRRVQPNVRILVLGPVPRWRASLSEILIKNQLAGRDDPETRFGFEDGILALDERLARTFQPGEYVSTYRALCPEGVCLIRVGPGVDDLLHIDAHHLSPAASRYLIRSLDKLVPLSVAPRAAE